MMDWMLLDGQDAKERIKSEDHQQQLPDGTLPFTARHDANGWCI